MCAKSKRPHMSRLFTLRSIDHFFCSFQVAAEVEDIKGEIKDLLRQTDTLQEKEMSLNPEGIAKEVEGMFLQVLCLHTEILSQT